MSVSDNLNNVRSKDYLLSFSEITNKFEIIDKVGEGTFASVFSVKSKGNPYSRDRLALKFTIPVIESKRIANEMRILKKLGGKMNIIKLHMAFRIRDHIFMLMPFINHQKFGDYFLSMDVEEIRLYLINLLSALNYVHENKIIHRDVKPNNFLYDRRRKKFSLIDFGLAHSELHGDLGSWFNDDLMPPDSIGNDSIKIHRRLSWGNGVKESGGNSMKYSDSLISSSNQPSKLSSNIPCVCGTQLASCVGCRNKLLPNARRGGTVGYRPPEVMMRHPEQTTALDIWAVGIILGTFLTARYPFLNGDDDMEILFEVVNLISYERVQLAAQSIERKLIVEPKPPPLVQTKIQWLYKRCIFMRNHSQRIKKLKHVSGGQTEDNMLTNQCVYSHDYKFDMEAYQLLSSLLEPDYRRRISAKDALNHSFLKKHILN